MAEENAPQRHAAAHVGRRIIAFIPANLIQALVAFGIVYAFTRLLSPEEFGRYSLVVGAVMIAQASAYYGLGAGIVRFHPPPERAEEVGRFLRTGYAGFFLISLALLPGCVLLWILVPRGDGVLVWLGFLYLMLRSLVMVNQSVNRVSERAWRFNLVESVQSLAGVAAGLALCILWRPTASALLVGLLVASAMAAAVNPRLLLTPLDRSCGFDKESSRTLIRFVLPIALSYMTGFVAQYADRVVLGTLGGMQALGIYAVAVSIVDRPLTLVSVSVTTASFPIAVRTLERDGTSAAARQMGVNAMALLSVSLPACVGLALCSRHVATVLVGEQFRHGAAVLIPIICVTVFLRCMSAHFIDQFFHLTCRSDMLMRLYAPVAVANVVLDAVAVPLFGTFGLVFAALACQAGALIVGTILARRVFPLSLPVRDIGKIAAATALMGAVVANVPSALTWSGLGEKVAVGAAVYAAAVVAMNLANSRMLICHPLQRFFPQRVG